jgi:hypothetical protein
VFGRELRGTRVFYLVDPKGQGTVKKVAESVVLHRWRRRQFEGYVFGGCRLNPRVWRALPDVLGDGRVLLLSPIVGEFSNEQAQVSFSPPYPTRIMELAEAGQFKAPAHCAIHVGEEDWQSIPANVQTLGELTGITVTVVPKGGHDLGKKYVGPLLDRWLEPLG